MGISRNCGFSFKITSVAEIVIEILACSVSVLLGAYAWISQQESVIYIYHETPATRSYVVTNKKLKACVTYWILTIMLLFTIIRLIAIVVFAVALRKNSVSMSKLWIGTKIIVLMASSFLFIASMTVDVPTRIAASVDFGAQIGTSYFLCILIPELEVMAKTIIVKVKEST